jgi:hypothetical protein
MLLAIVATIAGITALALLGGAVGSFEGKKPTAGWSYLGGAFVVGLAFAHYGVFMGHWDLPGWVPFGSATLGRPEAPSWLQRTDGPRGPASPEQLKGELEVKMKELGVKRAAFDKVLNSLKKEKTETIDALTNLKINSVAGLKDNPLAQRKAARLQEIVQEMDGIQKKTVEYDLALDQGQTVLRKLDRQLTLKEAGISDDELHEVTVTLTLFDEKLKASDTRVSTPLQVESVLKKELGWTE